MRTKKAKKLPAPLHAGAGASPLLEQTICRCINENRIVNCSKDRPNLHMVARVFKLPLWIVVNLQITLEHTNGSKIMEFTH